MPWSGSWGGGERGRIGYRPFPRFLRSRRNSCCSTRALARYVVAADHLGAPGKPGHHHNPFEGGYCLVNGVCNKLLDRTHFFRKLEHAVYKITGAEANCWEKPEIKALALDPSTRKRPLDVAEKPARAVS